MRRWARLAAIGMSGPLALLLVQCGGGDSSARNDDVRLPERLNPLDGGSDGSRTLTGDSAAAPDAAPACDPSKPFGAPVRVAGFDEAASRSTPRLSPDELSIYFTSHAPDAGAELTVAKRPAPGVAFAGETILPQSALSNDNDPMVGADQLSLWFHSNRGGTADIFFATRAETSAEFGVAAPVPVIDQPTTNENHAYFRSTGEELWFISDRPGTAGLFDIYVSKRSDGTFAEPTRVAELSSPAQDWQPQPSEDGLTVLFASDREGGAGKMDLWLARRASVNEPFGAPSALTELNSPNVDQAGWLSADGCRIWFSSGRANDDDHQQLFFAERPY